MFKMKSIFLLTALMTSFFSSSICLANSQKDLITENDINDQLSHEKWIEIKLSDELFPWDPDKEIFGDYAAD